MSILYDVIIIGAGPAGLSAGIYAGRARLRTLIIEKGVDGGQITYSADIENYPGQVLEGESGTSLAERMAKQCEMFGCEKVQDTVTEVHLEGDVKKIICTKGSYETRTVIIAAGASQRPAGCRGEKEYTGKGVSYCATCDANFFRGLEVFVVGGGDSAVEEALFLTRFARKVTIIHRRDKLRAASSIQEKAFSNEKISFIWDSVVEELGGDGMLQKMILKNVKTGELTAYTADENDGLFGLFVFVGQLPNTGIFSGSGLTIDGQGYIPTDENMHTNIPGVYAAGDIRVKSLRQVITAASDGAIAATQADRYIGE